MRVLLYILTLSLFSFTGYTQSQFYIEDCKDSTNERSRRYCVRKSIEAHIYNKFNESKVSLTAPKGLNRIYLKFDLDAMGQIISIQIKANTPEQEEETKKALYSYDKIVRPDVEDENVIVDSEFIDSYTMMIQFDF